MANETKNAATGLILFRCNYTFANDKGQLRMGSIIVEAKDIAEAQQTAGIKLAALKCAHSRITSVTQY